MGQIVVFSKSECPHCLEAKSILGELDIPYTEIDIESELRNSMLMAHVSKRHTVPQIFFNDKHIGGAHELKMLDKEAVQSAAQEALRAPTPPEFMSASYTLEELQAAIIPIKDYLDPHLPADPTSLPEYEAVRIWYSNMFGFLCNLYDQMSLKPEPMALFIGALSAMMALVDKQVGMHFGVSCLATAFAANCSYCSAHGADLSMKYAGESPEDLKALYDYLRNERELEELPFDDKLKVIIKLSAGMTTQDINLQDMAYAGSVVGPDQLRELCHSVGAMGSLMGFLNRFNDLVGVEIEASIKQSIDHSVLAEGWDWGTHDTEDDYNRHDYREPQEASDTTFSAQEFSELVNKVRMEVFHELEGLHNKYNAFERQSLPSWVSSYPDEYSNRSISALYHSVFNAGDLPSETKHIAAYVLALGAGHAEIAAEERRIAEHITDNTSKLQDKWRELDGYALSDERAEEKADEIASDTVLSSAEILAVRLARVSQSFPHIVRGELVQQLAKEFSAAELVELIIALSVIGMGQRWININKPLAEYENSQSL